MSERQTISINGRHYDAMSGLAVDTPGIPAAPAQPASPSNAHRATTPAGAVHARPSRSHTLNRKTTKRPQATPVVKNINIHQITPHKKPAHTVHRPAPNQSNHIAKFAPHPAPVSKKVIDTAAVAHPHVVKAHALSHAKAHTPATVSQAPQRTPSEIKQSAIQKAVENTSSNHKQVSKGRLLKRHPRKLSIVSASLALVLLGGYLTYLNMPSLSVRVAAAQAGISAAYPDYKPDGYSLNGTVGYSQGKVTMKFASNGGPQSFDINQTKSNWDSAAVLDNYVTPRAGASYIPYTERGLTIYTYGNNAAWVNGGILYTIEGNAPLSSEQIRRIATSLI